MRGETLTYTQAEIDSKINILENNLDGYLYQRKALNKTVRDVRKQIEYWRTFDIH